MKKTLIIFLVLPVYLYAAPITKELASNIGENFFSKSIEAHRVAGKQVHFIGQQQPNMRKVRQNTGNTYAPYYIFNNEDGGFVIVAGDNCATPILGYSTEGSIDMNNLPIQLEELLNAYAEEIQLAVDNNQQATDSIQTLWDAYNRAPQSQNAITVVPALIATTWSQSPYYNIKCPSDASLSSHGGHPTTGCVATAMGQIMKYWEYPENGIGNKSYPTERYGTLSANFALTTYDWANMPEKLSSATSSIQNDAVATLLYHCGVAVSMNYNSDGKGSSGAQILASSKSASAENALKTYFGYSSTLEGKKWTSSISMEKWKNMLKLELDNQRPILYAGFSKNGGHAFVCDGYDSDDYFHFNWGWGGIADGFYSLNAMTPSGRNYSEGQQAVIGIKPNDGPVAALKYDLFMNTDLEATNTSSATSTTDVNPYTFGKTISFRAKVENNGTGAFYGSFKVAVFTNNGEFVAWSKESYHFSLGAGKHTEWQNFTFDGGVPFVPGKYRAYMYYQDDGDNGCYLVKTDEGVFLTEYNNVVFTVTSSGDLVPTSKFLLDDIFNSFTTGCRVRINVSIKNSAVLSTFYGKIKLGLYNTEGSLAQVIEEYDFSAGLAPLTTMSLSFSNIVEVEPATYYLALTYKASDENAWYYLRSIDAYPNPIKIIVSAPVLYADEYENNDTQSTATSLAWEINDEIEDFSTYQVSLHDEDDIDYYKLIFPEAYQYKIDIRLYGKYNPGGKWYENANAHFSYSTDGITFSDYYEDNTIITLNGPTTLYVQVQQNGLDGLGYYELSGDVEETVIGTALEIPKFDSSVSKTLYNSQLLIIRDGEVYNATGARVE